jgi:hypothetical protein
MLGRKLNARETSYISALQQKGVMETEAAQQMTLAKGQRANDNVYSSPKIQVSNLIRKQPEGSFPGDPMLVQPTGAPKGAYPVEGQPRVTAWGNKESAAGYQAAADEFAQSSSLLRQQRDFAERQLKSIADEGFKPLDITPIMNRLNSKLSEKTTRVNSDEVLVLNTLRDKFRIAAEGGVTDPLALYQIRKLAVNDVINQLSNTTKLSKSEVSAVLTKLKPMIDDAIESTGAAQWGKGYMNKYSKGFQAIERVQLLDDLRRLQKNNPQGFLDVIQGESPKVIQDVMEGKKGITDAFSKNTVAKLQGIGSELQRDIKIKELASMGSGELQSVLEKDAYRARLPALVDAWFSAANKGIDVAERMLNRKVMSKLYDSMKNGKDAATLLETLPTEEKNQVLLAMKNSGMIKYLSAGTASAMEGNKQ